MNVVAHQEKEKNEKMGEREARVERKQEIDFEGAACCPPAVVQGTARRENGLSEGSARGNWDPRKGNSHFDQLKLGSETTLPRRGCY